MAVVARHLDAYVGPEDAAWLFPGPDGEPPCHQWFYRSQWSKARAALGKRGQAITPHTLRHFALTRAAEAGATVPELLEIAGHTSVRMALTYQHMVSRRRDEIARRMDAIED